MIDTVDHGILLNKLRAYGVFENIYLWLKTIKMDVSNVLIVIKGAASDWSRVTSEIPQGSILGPLLFVIFINDLPHVLPPEVRSALYDDDKKLHSAIRSTQDCEIMQLVLTNLNKLSSINNIRFNDPKCKVLTVTRKKTSIMSDYYLNSTRLVYVFDMRKTLV